jgi:serine/threonine protein kinase/tetratricopeptide (TPR) repeat protein
MPGASGAPEGRERSYPMADTNAADRHLLFGLIALQVGLIDQAQLVAAFQAWARDKGRPMADFLASRGDLDADGRAAVEAMVSLHLKKHGDTEKSLAAIHAGRSARDEIAAVGDAELTGLITQVGSDSSEAGSTRTASYAVGASTADGQRFRVLRPHAQGGLGAVFVALDGELHREVALKQILDHHADHPVSRQRFVTEAEITGGLEHPGIVPVYGLGSYADGRPYYAMRFIRGDSLKEAIDRFHKDETLKKDPGRRSLELSKLLRRFLDICNAIGYAHSRGVLHRDIKPGNVIVGKFGETLVVDWGLAKAAGRSNCDPESAERPLTLSSASGSAETLPGSALGTPAYMSPEQARGDLDALGPHSDVYSLGATLYSLLTGKAPFEGDVGEVLRRVEAGDFTPPRQLDPSIDRALEAVCLKAMATRPGDRYPSTRALAEDVERWLADEPVAAWREPWTRSLIRWLTRHRTGVTAAGAALLVALAGLAAVLGVEARANGQLTAKNSQLDAALLREADRFRLAMDAIKLFHGEVSEDLLLKEKKFEGLRRKLLLGAADFYGKLERLLEGQADPKSRAALGKSYSELAEVTLQIGKYNEALALHLKALAVRRDLAARPGAGVDATLDLVGSLYDASVVHHSIGGAADALALVGEATDLADGLEATGRGSDALRKRLAECLNYAAVLYDESRQGVRNPTKAMGCIERAKALAERLAASNPGDNGLKEILVASFTTYGMLLEGTGRSTEAEEAQRRAVAIANELAETNPNVSRYQNDLGRAYTNLVRKLWFVGKPAEAMVARERAVAIWQKVADDNPAVTSYQNNLAFGLNNLGSALSEMGELAGAMQAYERARSIMKALVEADLSAIAHRRNLANSQLHIGWLRQQLGQPAEALAEYKQELETRRSMESADPTNSSYRDSLANCETNIASVLLQLGNPGEGRGACDRAIAIRQRLVEADPANTSYRSGLAESLLRSGQLRRSTGDIPGAAADWRRAVGLYEGLPARSGEVAAFEACCHAMLSGLAGLTGAGVSVSDGPREADRAMAILRRIVAQGYRAPLLRLEPALDPLRPRPDFQALMMDVAFPAAPFLEVR